MSMNLFERVVNLINEASLTDRVHEKVTRLVQVKELIIHRDSSLLDNFFEEVAAFQHDGNFEVRKIVIEFIQEACHVDPTLLKKGIGYLFYLFTTAVHQESPSVNLLRCLIQAVIPIYRIALTRAVKIGIVESGVAVGGQNGIAAESAADVALETFRSVASLKDEIVRLVLPSTVPGQSAFGFVRSLSANDGVRLDALTLVQSVIVLHSRRLPNSYIPRSSEGDISLDQIPEMTNTQLQQVLNASTAASSASLLPGVCLVRPRRLADEAERLLSGLLDLPVRGASATGTGVPISYSLLEHVMDSLVNIARQRPQFMDRIVQAFETVHVTLPPHFSDVQVSSVRKKLKQGLLQLLRCSAAVSEYQGRITILLTDLGATQSEVFEALHRTSEIPLNRDTSASFDATSAHGDVDMRQMRLDAVPVIGTPQSTVPCTAVTSAQTPSRSGQQSTQMNATPGSTQSRTPQTPTTESGDRGKSFADGFSFAQTEVALRFDDDDDDDDDIQVASSKRVRAGKSKRRTLAASSGSTASRITGTADPKGSGGSAAVKRELPSIDLVTTQLVPRLTTANVADLVLLSMVTLPDQMPAAFQSTYTPIAAAGTSAQIRHLARLLAVQLVVWAGESSDADAAENISQLKSVLRNPAEDMADSRTVRHKRASKSELGGSADVNESKDGVRSKKRRLASASSKAVAGDDAEAEDALIRANAARHLQPMNISTLVGYKHNQQQKQQQQQQQEQQQVDVCSISGTTPAVVTPSLMPGLPPMFPNIPPPGMPGGNILMAPFNPAQPPPPLMMMMMPNAMNPAVPSTTFSQTGTTSATAAVAAAGAAAAIPSIAMADIPLPTPARPFSLEAVTVPIHSTIQRQLAQDAFSRIIEGLEGTTTRFPTAVNENQVIPLTGTESLPSSLHLNRMKLLTRLTMRRFGGNEFYKILIEYAIKNLKHGFELLSKLLMQEYCRFRGFQLVGFSAFLHSRRNQLSLLRARQNKSAENTDTVDSESGMELVSDQQQNVKQSNIEDTHEPTRDRDDGHDDLTAEPENDISEEGGESQSNQSVCRNIICVSDSSLKREEPGIEPEETGLKRSSGESKAEKSDNDKSGTKMESKGSVKPSTLTRDGKLGISKAPNVTPPDDLGCLSFYDCLLVDVLQRLKHPDIRQIYFGRFLIEAPLLTSGAISVLKRYCSNPTQAAYGFQVLRTLIELRPVSQREYLLNMLLSFCAVEDTEIRRAALTATRELVNLDDRWKHHIESFATDILRKLTQPRPTPDIYPFTNHPVVPSKWNDESCQACAHLFLGLMPQSPSLMHKLAEVYVNAGPEVKRSVLRMIDQPIREIGIYSLDLHELVDRCPLGAETLITRMIHLLTDSPSAVAAAAAAAAAASTATANTPGAQKPGTPAAAISAPVSTPSALSTPAPVIMPPASLVDRVYRLYSERVHDVRCLIPILVGLSKQEVIAALPRLILLNEKVVKEVLTRLLNASVATQYAPRINTVRNMACTTAELLDAPLGPLKPEELLVAIHLLEFAKDPNDSHSTKPYIGLQDILHACRVCFAERRLFTQERLSMAIGQLLEQPVLPTLFMRTVMQALALHPRLAGYVINVLVRLIRKQVWKSKQLWDGFIRCCIKLRPQSYQVLLQLPPERLESVFQREPSMRAQVRRHVENFSSAQRVHISKSIIAVLEHVPTPSPPSTPVLTESVGNETMPGKAQPNGSPASAASSGPGTPTRDEIPAHEVQAAIVAAAAAILQNPSALDATEPHLDDANSCPPESEGSQQDGPSQQHPLSVLVCSRTSGGTASSNGDVFGSRSSRTMDERFQYVPRFRPTSTRTYTRARNRSPHQEPSSPIPEDNPSEAVDKHQRHSPTSRGSESVRIEDQTSECHPLESSMEDDDLEPPILPATRLKSAPKRVPVWSRSSSDEVNTLGVSSEFLDTKEEQQKEAGNLATVALRQPKRPVDLDKLEADRKRLMEESIRFRQQKAEAKQSKSVNPSSQPG